MAIISFKLNEKLYLRDPQTSDLGQRIVSQSISMIDQMGFEQFTFKKLAEEIGSTEASVYRYFENKHRLLVYLIDWYWTWLEYRINFQITNIKEPKEKLKTCLLILTEENKIDDSVPFIDENALQRVVVAEFEKTYLTKTVDDDNKDGLFLSYKHLCRRVADIIHEINPNYGFARSLVSTAMLSITHQLYYAEHLPSLTDIKYNPRQHRQKLYDFLENLILKTIGR
jgi:AcrR family transcriptional regulator